MSSPSKRPSAVGASHPDLESTKISLMKLLAAPMTMLASFICLLGFPGAEAKAEITRMFSEWGVNSWVDMACFAVENMEKFIVASESAALCLQRLRKQLGFLVEYTRLGRDIALTMSIQSEICAVDEYCAAPHKSDPRLPTLYTYSFHDSRMCTYTVWVNKVATHNQMCLVASILLDFIYHCQLNKLIIWAWFAIQWVEVKTAKR